MATTITTSSGALSVNFLGNNEAWTEKIGYIPDNILDSANSDTDKIASDIWSFTAATNDFVSGTAMDAEVTYTAKITSDS